MKTLKQRKLQNLILLATFAEVAENAESNEYLLKLKEERQRRKCWTREWILRRQAESRGVVHLAHEELRLEDEESFVNFFRMDISLFHVLLEKISLFIKKQDTVMRRSISPKERLSVTLRFLATGESYRSLEFSTRIPACTLSRIIPETCRVLYEVLRSDYLQTPQKKEEWEKIAQEYLHLWNVPNCLGAMDGKHINFKAPLNQGSLYYNYKGTNSIVLLALVDARYRFLYVYAGTNGRVSDDGVFRDSDLASVLEDTSNPLNIPDSKPLPGMIEAVPHVILADAAFPLQTNILKPYPSRNLSHDERIYNYRLSRARRVVENAFGMIANRFRVLLSTIYLKVETVQNIVLVCCTLHNFLSNENVQFMCDSVDVENIVDCEVRSACWTNSNAQLRDLPVINVRPTQTAIHVRNIFKEYFNSITGQVSWQKNMI